MNIFDQYLDKIKKTILELSKKGNLILPDNLDGITAEITIKTKLAFGVGATGEGATNWIFAGLTFFFYNLV